MLCSRASAQNETTRMEADEIFDDPSHSQSGDRRGDISSFDESSSSIEKRSGYFFVFSGGPLTRLAKRSTSTSTRSAILMKGMPLFIP